MTWSPGRDRSASSAPCGASASTWSRTPATRAAPRVSAPTAVIATWPLLLRVRARTGKRPWLAVVFMTGVVLLALILPFGMAVSTLLDALHRSVAGAPAAAGAPIPVAELALQEAQ